MDAANYTEIIDYGSAENMIGKSSIFMYKLDGNCWHISGSTDRAKFDEIWERVK
jgi:hypothetical protein